MYNFHVVVVCSNCMNYLYVLLVGTSYILDVNTSCMH